MGDSPKAIYTLDRICSGSSYRRVKRDGYPALFAAHTHTFTSRRHGRARMMRTRWKGQTTYSERESKREREDENPQRIKKGEKLKQNEGSNWNWSWGLYIHIRSRERRTEHRGATHATQPRGESLYGERERGPRSIVLTSLLAAIKNESELCRRPRTIRESERERKKNILARGRGSSNRALRHSHAITLSLSFCPHPSLYLFLVLGCPVTFCRVGGSDFLAIHARTRGGPLYLQIYVRARLEVFSIASGVYSWAHSYNARIIMSASRELERRYICLRAVSRDSALYARRHINSVKMIYVVQEFWRSLRYCFAEARDRSVSVYQPLRGMITDWRRR